MTTHDLANNDWLIYDLPGGGYVARAMGAPEAFVADSREAAVAGLEALRERLAAKRLVTIEIEIPDDLAAKAERVSGGPAGSGPFNAYVVWAIELALHRQTPVAAHQQASRDDQR